MNDLVTRDRERVWHPYTQTGFGVEPLGIVSAKGSYLTLEDGRSILDGISSWWCCLHGHGHSSLRQAASEQFEKLDHIIFGGFTHEPAVRLSEALCEVAPHNFQKVFFSDNGSTAVEVAIKLALQVWRNRGEKRTKLIALEEGYHGDTFGAMSVGARSIFTEPFDDLLFSVDRLSLEATERDLERAEALCRAGEVAAFIFEPVVQGVGGMRMYAPSALDSYCAVMKRYGVLCIADEVMTGFGRTGPLFASASLKEAPDILCLSKGITSGTLPLAVSLCRDSVFNEFISSDHSKTFFHGHTYTANPIACAVALASLQLTISAECLDARERIAARHREVVEGLSDQPGIVNARSRGTIVAFDLIRQGDQGYGNGLAERARDFFVQRGVLVRPLGNVVYLMPPYCFTDDELGRAYDAMKLFVSEVTR
jgi:adenosylmethionine-8-amino-7-oxononanoate aminotransferase